MPTGEVDDRLARIVDFDPIGGLAVFVESRADVISQKLADDRFGREQRPRFKTLQVKSPATTVPSQGARRRTAIMLIEQARDRLPSGSASCR